MAKIYLMRWKKLAFVHDWRRRKKSDSVQVKQANLYLDDALAATIIIHDLSPTKEVPINSYAPSLEVVKKAVSEVALSPPVDPKPSEENAFEPVLKQSELGIPLIKLEECEQKPGEVTADNEFSQTLSGQTVLEPISELPELEIPLIQANEYEQADVSVETEINQPPFEETVNELISESTESDFPIIELEECDQKAVGIFTESEVSPSSKKKSVNKFVSESTKLGIPLIRLSGLEKKGVNVVTETVLNSTPSEEALNELISESNELGVPLIQLDEYKQKVDSTGVELNPTLSGQTINETVLESNGIGIPLVQSEKYEKKAVNVLPEYETESTPLNQSELKSESNERGIPVIHTDEYQQKAVVITTEIKERNIPESSGIKEKQNIFVVSEQNVATVEERITLEMPNLNVSNFTNVRIKVLPKEFVYANFKDTHSGLKRKQQGHHLLDFRESLGAELSVNEHKGTQRSSLNSVSFSTFRDERYRQKQEIADLNDLFASLIEKTRFYEADNKRKQSNLQKLHKIIGSEKMFIKENADTRRMVCRLEEEKTILDKEHTILKNSYSVKERDFELASQLEHYERKEIDRLILEYSRIEYESNLLRRRISEIEDEVEKLKENNIFYKNLLNTTRKDAATQRISKLERSNDAYALIQEILLLHQKQDEEIKELQNNILRKMNKSYRERFKNDFVKAVRKLRKEHEDRTVSNRTELEFWLEMKLKEMRLIYKKEELDKNCKVKELNTLKMQLLHLRTQLAFYQEQNLHLTQKINSLSDQIHEEQLKYRANLEDNDKMIIQLRRERNILASELENLFSAKQDLKQEITIYRSLLDKTSSHLNLGREVKIVKPRLITTEIEELRLNQVGEITSKTIFQQAAKGNVIIKDVATDGSYVTLENTSSIGEETIGSWKIQRCVSSSPDTVFIFPYGFVLEPQKTIKVWAKGKSSKYHLSECPVFEETSACEINDKTRTALLNVLREVWTKDKRGGCNLLKHSDFEKVVSYEIGDEAKTALLNNLGEERAVHLQKSSIKAIVYK